MEEKPIKITIENFKEKTITFTMPEDGKISILKEYSSDYGYPGAYKRIEIHLAHKDGIDIEEEELIE